MPLITGKSKESFDKNLKTEMHHGKPLAQSLAIAYAQKRKAQKMAHGGHVHDEHCAEGCAMAEGGLMHPSMHKLMEEDQHTTHNLHEAHTPYAMGGDVVDHIMRKRYSEGGRVANGGEDELSHLADGAPNNFDDLALRDHLESNNSGATAGDFLGNAQEDEDRHDIIARIMRQRSMKQSNPRPA